MSTLLYVDQWEAAHTYKTIRHEVTQDKIIKTAAAALSGMQAVLTQSIQGVKASKSSSPDEHTVAMSHSGEQVDVLWAQRRGRLGIRVVPASQYEAHKDLVDQFIDGLRGSIDRQQKFIGTLQSELNEAGKIFVDRADTHLSSARLFRGIMCADCGEVVNAQTYKAHRQSMKCMTMTMNRDVRETGYSEVDHGPHITAIKKSGIEIEVRPTGYAIWAPEWVKEAIKAYEEHKAGGGFAGLSLSEYLEKMKP